MTPPRTWLGTSWKMTHTIAEARAYARALQREALGGGLPQDVQLFILPAHTALAAVAEELSDLPQVWVGAQSAHPGPEGAGTGEISVRMVAEAGARMVEIGHSERRADRGEDDVFVATCTRAVVDAGLIPLVCVGEPSEVRRAGNAVEHVVAQVRSALSQLAPLEISEVVIAYEPVWAIGSAGRPAEPGEVTPVLAAVAEEARGAAGDAAAGLRALLYGGSVDPATAPGLLRVPEVDGLFVGRAAWNPQGLLDLARAAAWTPPADAPTSQLWDGPLNRPEP